MFGLSTLRQAFMPAKAGMKYNAASLSAYSVVLAGAWIYAAASFGTSVSTGGIPVLIYGALGICLLQSLFLVNLSEFASAHPSGGGIPHYSRILAGPKWGSAAEYTVGCMHTLGACFSPAGATIGMVQVFATCGSVLHPDWVPQRWQLFLGFQASNVIVVLFILYANKLLAWMNRIAVFIVVVGLFICIGLLVGHAKEKQPSSFVWKQLQNGTGFSSDAYCVVLGLCLALYAYGVPHWIVSLSDETENPSRAVPIAFGVQQLGNCVTLVAFFITAGYVITDYDALLETLYPSPIGLIFQQATGSQAGTVGLLVLIGIPQFASLVCYYNVCMMLGYGYFRTKSVPKWEWLVRRHARTNEPMNILFCLAIVNFLLGFVYLGSLEGFAILLSAPGVLYFSGYIVPLAAHVATQGRNLGTNGWFRLPRTLSVALAVFNIFSLVFLVVLLCLPRSSPIIAASMNWTCLFLVFGMAVAALLWRFYGKTHYQGVVEVIETAGTDSDVAVESASPKGTDNLFVAKDVL